MGFVAIAYGPFAGSDALRNLKNFIGSTKGGLSSFLGIPFAKPPYVPMSPQCYDVLTLAQYRKQALPPS